MKKIIIVASLLLMVIVAWAQDTTQYERKLFIQGADTLCYRILYPADYNPSRKYPVITFLHGSGERGSDNAAQLMHGASLFLTTEIRNQYKAIVIFPQCPRDSSWRKLRVSIDTVAKMRSFDLSFAEMPTTPARLVKALLDDLIQSGKADAKRMYIGGLSMGGFGTFDMLERYPKFFAAGFPICGGGDTNKAPGFAKTIPVWIFHGDADPAVNVVYSRNYVTALKNAGADVVYNEYPGVGHNSWDNAFAEKNLVPWLMAHKRKRK